MSTPYRRRHDATGRTDARSGRSRKMKKTWLQGAQFVALRKDMLEHDAFQALDDNARRVLDRLILEFLRTGGQENGKLVVTWDQFQAHGCTRRLIRRSLRQLIAGGFVRTTVQGGMDLGERVPSQYRLTFLPINKKSPPTDEWKGMSANAVHEARTDWEDRRSAAQRRRRTKTLPPTIDSGIRTEP